MRATNYCTDYLWSGVKDIDSEDYRFTKYNNETCVHDGIKFGLPDNGVVLEVVPINDLSESALTNGFSKYIEYLKLPYESTVLEYLQTHDVDGNEVGIKTIVFLGESQRGGIHLSIATKDVSSAGKWAINDVALFIESDLTFQAKSMSGRMGKVDDRESMILLHAANAVLSFLAALQCSNVIQVNQPAPKFINKTREKKNKPPFFSYKVLTIDTKGKVEDKKKGGGTGNTKRVHLRRGHIRRLADRTVWVNPCVVGDKSKGMVTKDYRVI